MSTNSSDETLSIPQVVELVVKNTGEQMGQVVLALLVIVKALKEQPGFDASAFNAQVSEAARTKTEDSESLLRIILLAAAGQPGSIEQRSEAR